MEEGQEIFDPADFWFEALFYLAREYGNTTPSFLVNYKIHMPNWPEIGAEVILKSVPVPPSLTPRTVWASDSS